MGGIIETKEKVVRMALASIVWLFLTVGQHLQFLEFQKFLNFSHITFSLSKFQTKWTEFSHSPQGFGALGVQ